jgi:hypothetical protein
MSIPAIQSDNGDCSCESATLRSLIVPQSIGSVSEFFAKNRENRKTKAENQARPAPGSTLFSFSELRMRGLMLREPLGSDWKLRDIIQDEGLS